MKAPFVYFGAKRLIADLVWERFGDVSNYVEPFFGSGAVLLARPHEPNWETVNDINNFVMNFWRALQADPEAVAKWCDKPVHEIEIHAVHKWLLTAGLEIVEQCRDDMTFYDAKVAGLWVWGMGLWIGDGWCESYSKKLPQLMNSRGVVSLSRNNALLETLEALSVRLRRVRTACGDWNRVLGKSVTTEISDITGVFLDPPYDGFESVYKSESVSSDVFEWALANGDNPRFRIALCGYEGEHEMPDSWECVAWKANGGYSSSSKSGDNGNGNRERIWFSPHCLKRSQQNLFERVE